MSSDLPGRRVRLASVAAGLVAASILGLISFDVGADADRGDRRQTRLRFDTACCTEGLDRLGIDVERDVDGVLGRVDLLLPPGWVLQPEPGTDGWLVLRGSDRSPAGDFQGRLIGVFTDGRDRVLTREG